MAKGNTPQIAPAAAALQVGIAAGDNRSFPMIIARRFLISGRVQGVGYRFFVQDHAAVEGVHGFVRNLPDGRVEAVVEGDDASVVRVERALRRGPSAAQVEEVIVEEVAPSGRATGFSIR